MNKFETINTFYLKNNLKIFPVMENKKLPLIDAWQKECSSDIKQVVYWLENAKNCNIGLPANENDLFIIDIDMHGVNGIKNFSQLLRDLDISITEINTLGQVTPSGGIHFIFKSDNELKNVTNSANCFKDYPGIDIRTKGYILVEPSVINGKPYKLDRCKTIKEVPDKLRTFILENEEKEHEVRKESGYIKPTCVERGGRDTALFEYLNELYYKTRLDKEDIRLLAYNFNINVCKPSLSERVVDYKLDKLFKKDRSKVLFVNLGEQDENDRND